MDIVSKESKWNFIKLTDTPFDVEKLYAEVLDAEKKHAFLVKAARGWLSIPLRSVGGLEGNIGNLGGGANNSANPDDYNDTAIMDECPYLRELINSFGAKLLKVRIMKLLRTKKIGNHIDNFGSPNIIRFHIPIVTDPKVKVIIENSNLHLKLGHLYWINVRKQHSVENNSKNIDRIHLVFDMYFNDSIKELLTKTDNEYFE